MTQRLDDLLPKLHPDMADAGPPTQTPQPQLLRNRSQLMRRRHTALTAIERYLDRALRVEQRLRAFPFRGSEPLGVAAAERLLQELHYLDDLLRRMRWHPGRMMGINPERLQHFLDQAGVAPSQQLERLETLLEQAGLVRRTATGTRLPYRGGVWGGDRRVAVSFPIAARAVACHVGSPIRVAGLHSAYIGRLLGRGIGLGPWALLWSDKVGCEIARTASPWLEWLRQFADDSAQPAHRRGERNPLHSVAARLRELFLTAA